VRSKRLTWAVGCAVAGIGRDYTRSQRRDPQRWSRVQKRGMAV